MKRRIGFIFAAVTIAAAAYAAVRQFEVKADEFDPAHTHLVQGTWLEGIGCPTNAATTAGANPPCTVTAGVCDISNFELGSLAIVFDEGYDTAPDNFGMAVLDNIDVNGVLVGKGPTDAD